MANEYPYNRHALVLGVFINCFWAANQLSMGDLSGTIHYAVYNALRLWIAFPLLLGLTLVLERKLPAWKESLTVVKKSPAVLAVWALCGTQAFFINLLSMSYAYTKPFTTASVSGALTPAIPVFVAFLSSVVTKGDSLTLRKKFGVLIGFSAAVISLSPKSVWEAFTDGSKFSDFVGRLILFLNTVQLSVRVILLRKFLRISQMPPLLSQTGMCFVASLLMIPTGYFVDFSGEVDKMEAKHWATVLWLAIGGTAGAYSLQAWALPRCCSVSVFTSLNLLVPFAVMFGRFILYEEYPTQWELIGSCILPIAFYLIFYEPPKKPEAPVGTEL